MPDEKAAIVIKAFQVVYRLEKYIYFLLLCYKPGMLKIVTID